MTPELFTSATDDCNRTPIVEENSFCKRILTLLEMQFL